MPRRGGRGDFCSNRLLALLYVAVFSAGGCLLLTSSRTGGGLLEQLGHTGEGTTYPGEPRQRPDTVKKPTMPVTLTTSEPATCQVVVDRPGGIDERYLYERRWVEELTGTCIWTIQECKAAGRCDPLYVISRLHGGNLNKLEKETFGNVRSQKILLHLSDEARQVKFKQNKRQEYARWKQVFRFYYDAEYEDMPSVHWVPLGYASTGFDWSQLSAPILPASQRQNDACFTGNTGNNGKRKDMVQQFETATRMKVQGITRSAGFGAGDREDYVNSMLSSRFCLAPPGSSFETFRLYEALQAGCVPVVLEQWSAGKEPGREAEGLKWNNFTAEVRPYVARVEDMLSADADVLQEQMRDRWRQIKAFHKGQVRAAAREL